MSDLDAWLALVPEKPKAESVSADDPKKQQVYEALSDIIVEASALGVDHPVWVMVRRKSKTGEFDPIFEDSDYWDGTEENRVKQFHEWLASPEYAEAFKAKHESLSLSEDVQGHAPQSFDPHKLARMFGCVYDNGKIRVMNNDEIDEIQAEAKNKPPSKSVIVIAWSYESNKFYVRVPNEDLKWFDNKTAARKYALRAQSRTAEQPRGYRVYDYTRPAGQRMWHGGNEWGPIKKSRKKISEDTAVDSGMVAVVDPCYLLAREEYDVAFNHPEGINRGLEQAIRDKFLPEATAEASALISVIDTRVGDGVFEVCHEGGDIVVKTQYRPMTEDKKGEITKKFTVTASPETMKVFESFMALLHWNGRWGHSACFGMSFDGDGDGRFTVDGMDVDRYKKAVHKVVDHSSTIDYVELANKVSSMTEE